MTTAAPSRKQLKSLLYKANEAAAEKNLTRAAQLYEEYLKSDPHNPKVLFNLGALRQQAAGLATTAVEMHALSVDAIEFYSRAIESPEVDSECKADCLNNHGLVMQKLGFPEKAKIAFNFALQLNPEHRAARLNYADVLVFEGQYDEADRQFFEIINSDPNSAGAQFSRSMVLLTMGEIRRGFREYRSRFSVRSFPSKIMETDRPMWEGEDLNGKTLIVTLEQGYGDQIMFARYFGVIKERWPRAQVLFSVGDCMFNLMKGCEGLDGTLPDHLTPGFNTACPPFDYHIPLMHLPDVMGTTLDTIPSKCPYIVPHESWAPFTLPPSDKRKVGLVWAGSPRHGKDKWRSIEPEAFQPIIDAHSECQFYSLQCGPRCEEVLRLKNIISLAERISDWTDTAQAIQQLNLLITVDTAPAHLAGALGKPVWNLIGSSPDWRWMLSREDSPYYPTMRLFRQSERDDWQPVIDRINTEL
jgi:tetratricopeptide (TPR) repeat protein